MIADVADKGMPAALFMTLIRTLVRATVQEIDSPGKVLERVNEVLVPDARQGMFVTIIYAVLDLESGELVYANAGHNPPLLIRAATAGMESLERSGMALGVLEGNPVKERKLILNPQDLIVFYTDGLTEAFSSDGEMYGYQHLREVVQAAGKAAAERGLSGTGQYTARDILEAIVDSVNSFVGLAPASDDLTLLVLKRLPPGESANQGQGKEG